MLSPKDIQVSKLDVTLAATTLLVSHVALSVLENTEMFTSRWTYVTLATVIGFSLNGLFVSKISDAVNGNLKIQSVGIRNSINDLFKFGAVFITQRALGNYLLGLPIVFDQQWMMNSGLTIGGYALFNNFVESRMPSVGAQHQEMANDLVKFSMGYLLANVVVNQTLTQRSLVELATLLAGRVTFFMFTRQLVL